ncbi:RRM domain-containing protein [Mycena indigotica]|uniref:RRM domain-containing protein n=1 Tax=Mycena indigotica TaxID=2126181 RepID=A0A8H6SKG9_9AGAR|nr:RRM domain-containing protein [Mycena indigotica]KAF7301273.1 RRM domain-containing protein [Mycena indigotica]
MITKNLTRLRNKPSLQRSISQLAKGQHTISIQNVPPHALIGETLDVVLAGPIYNVEDILQPSRNVRITFYDSTAASELLEQVSNHPVLLYGQRLEFSPVMGQKPAPFHPTSSRTIRATFANVHMTENALAQQLTPFGAIDRFNFVKGNPSKAFISFLSARVASWAFKDLRQLGAQVSRVRDRCVTAALARTEALKNRSCKVALRGVPRNTTVIELADCIRGGALHNISYKPLDNVAYIHFTLHASALAFFEDALYRGIYLHGRRLHPQFEPDSHPFSPNLAESIKNGASRCITFHYTGPGHEPADLTRHCSRFGPVERVSTTGSSATVVFLNIMHAINAFARLPASEGFDPSHVRLRFEKDPSSRPLLSSVEAVGQLHSEVQRLLHIPDK